MNHSSGFSTINRYNPCGYLSSIARGDTEKDIWRLEEMNPRGQINRFALGNGLTTTHGYDEYGFLTGITTDPGIQSLTYNFDHATGNLSYRTDNKYILTEEFDYDENLLNSRLTQCKINGTVSLSTNYQNNGNIDTKSDVGTYSYSALKPHALKTVDVPEPGFVDNSPLQQITYTAVGKVRTITQDNPGSPGNPYLLNIYYGPDNQRIKSELFYGLTRINSKIFGQSGYESIVDQAGNKIQLHYLASPSGVFAVYVKANSVESLYYIHTDHLGSLYAITGEDGRIVTQNGEEAVYSFDAWGRRRNPVDWSYEGLPSDFLIDRGFTFHEHLDEFGLINMNGRVYDPVIGRFLSPDNYVQGGFTQSFNRYSYCQNNPLVYTDPTGEYVIWDDIIAAAVGGVINLATNAFQGNIHNIGDGLAAFGAGAVGGVGALYPEFGGWVWGGATVGATNAWLGGATSAKDIAIGAGVGAIAGVAGGAAGQWAGQYLGGMVINGFNVASPVIKGAITGTIGGAAGGYAGGFTGGLIMTGDFNAANKAGLDGLWSGAAVGCVVGAGSGYRYAKINHINPWTGVRNNSVTIGEGMYRIEPATKDLGNSNINDDWPNGMEAYYDKTSRMFNPDAMDFNGQWVENQMHNELYFYDIGTRNGGPVTSPFYNMELGRTMVYPNVINVQYIHYQQTIRILILNK